MMKKPENTKRKVTFVVASNNRNILENNFLASPGLINDAVVGISIKENYCSPSKAFNEAITEAKSDLIIFVHQDVYLPRNWTSKVFTAIEILEKKNARWGVLGCYGVEADNKRHGYIYDSGLRKIHNEYLLQPARVQTLDEIVLILRKSSGLRFDEELPGFHFYGTDICMQAADKGMENYAINAFCIHNSKQTIYLPKEFYCCYRYIRKKYWKKLPIQTSCIRVTKWNYNYFRHKLSDMIVRLKRRPANDRYPNPEELWKELKRKYNSL